MRDAGGFDDELLAELLLSAKLLTPDQLEEAKARLHSADFGTSTVPSPPAFVADSSGARVRAIDPTTGDPVGEIPLAEAPGQHAHGWSSGKVVIVDAADPAIRETLAFGPSLDLGLFPTSAGAFLYPGTSPNRSSSPDVAFLPSATVSSAGSSQGPLDLAGSQTGEFLIAADRGAGAVHVLVPNTRTRIGAIAVRPPGGVRSLGVAIHDRLAYITDGLTPRLTILELTTLKIRHQSFPTGPLGPVGITSDGQTLYLVFYKNTDELGLLTISTSDLRVRHLLHLPGRRIAGAPLEPFRIA
ncbi:MAG: hypothetical protein KGR26_13770, partial [Cyanobacteria bacterium REEB65]|nr:hypothetical protein [Cyanobacteria bacterium REEB65]